MGQVASLTESAEPSEKKENEPLVVVNEEKGVFRTRDLMAAEAEVVALDGALGSTYKATMRNGLSVMVRRTGAINQQGRHGFDANMRTFGRIEHANILPVLAYTFRRAEKLIISEYMPKGSLLHVLHVDRGTCHADLTWPVRLKIIKGIAQGLLFLHSHFYTYELPHGNLKSSNVLLTQDYEPLLSDYALHPLLNPNSFPLFAFKSPDYVEYQLISRKADVYCLGIVILEIITGKLPSQYHTNDDGNTTDVVQWVLAAISERREAQVIDPEIANTPNSLDHMLQILQVGAACTETNPKQRISLSEVIRRIEEVQA